MAHVDIVYIRHILDALERIAEYIQGVEETEFYRNNLLQDGVIRQLEIIGEATKQISQDTRAENEHIPWKDIAGMRDKLIHEYFGVDVEQVWLTAKQDAPVLRFEIAKILETLS